jgi:predicted metalloprotease with PDZ domain
MSQSNNMFYRLVTDHQRLRVVLVSLFAFCILVVSLLFFALSIGKPYMGTTLSMNNQGWAVETVDVSGQASQAGIIVGDRPIEINGQPAQEFLEKYRKAGVSLGRLIRELTVVGDQGQLKSVDLEDSSPYSG